MQYVCFDSISAITLPLFDASNISLQAVPNASNNVSIAFYTTENKGMEKTDVENN